MNKTRHVLELKGASTRERAREAGRATVAKEAFDCARGARQLGGEDSKPSRRGKSNTLHTLHTFGSCEVERQRKLKPERGGVSYFD